MANPPTTSAPWWQSIVAGAVNLLLAWLAHKYLGNAEALGVAGVGAGIAHAMTSPKDKV